MPNRELHADDLSARDLYGDDLLARALDPASQPAAIRAFLTEESTQLARLVTDGARVDAQAAVLREMRRLSPTPGSRVLSVYSPSSIEPRRAWYGRLGQDVVEETDRYLRTSGGFVTEHFTPERLREIVANGSVGYWVYT